MASLGGRLRAARERVGLTQKQLAEAAGIDSTLVSHYEADRREPSEEQRTKLREAIRAARGEPEVDWVLTPAGRRASPDERAAAMRSAIAWIQNTGRHLVDLDTELPRELRTAIGNADPLWPEDVVELIALARKLGGGDQTSDVRRAKREAAKWIAAEGFKVARLEDELRARWPHLPASERKELLAEAAYRRRMAALEDENRAGREGADFVRSPAADVLTLEQLRDELERRGLTDGQIGRLLETARRRREQAGQLDERTVAAITSGLIEKEF